MRFVIAVLLSGCYLQNAPARPETPCDQARRQALVETASQPSASLYEIKTGTYRPREPSPFLRQLQMECQQYLASGR